MISAACAFCSVVVATRSSEIGTDSRAYSDFFLTMDRYVFIETRLEPLFVLYTRLASEYGLGVVGFQAVSFILLLIAVSAASMSCWTCVGEPRNRFVFLATVFVLLFLSPVMVNASINLIRQGVASFLVILAMMAFLQKRWVIFSIAALTSVGFHYSSIVFLVIAPLLLLGDRIVFRLVSVLFLVYISGYSDALVLTVSPDVYNYVVGYVEGADYRAGVRLDFAVVSIVFLLSLIISVKLVRPDFRQKARLVISVYSVLLIPFFLVGFGNFSNRFLLPAWLSLSLIAASVVCCTSSRLVTRTGAIGLGLSISSMTFALLVANGVVV